MTNTAVDVLNRAFDADPNAVHAMTTHRVTCNKALAKDPSIVTDSGHTVGMLGFINGILVEMGLPLVAAKIRDNQGGPVQLLGFCEYPLPKVTR